MEGLSFDNILGEQEIDTLFMDPEEDSTQEKQNETFEEEDEVSESEDESKKEKKSTAETVDSETLFEEEQSESVGSGNKEEGTEDASTEEGSDGTSPTNFYTSIASACAVDGIFPNLDEDIIKKATDAESFYDLIDAEVNARLDDKQQRISKALENGIEPTDIRKYENTLGYINKITDSAIAEESDEGEQLRYNLIYQDFVNKGMSPEKAKKFTERTIDAGTDVEDAKEALQSNKEFFTEQYNRLLKDAQDRADKVKADRIEQAKKLETSIMKDKQLLGDMEISNDIRKKAFDLVSKPIYKDAETGQFLTAIQKYQKENPADFLKYTGLMLAMTDNFKDFKSFIKGEVKKEKRKGLRELEQTLNHTRRSSDGSLKMVTKRTEDPESFIGKGMQLDL